MVPLVWPRRGEGPSLKPSQHEAARNDELLVVVVSRGFPQTWEPLWGV